MDYPIFRDAKVVSVDDPEEFGRIQLRVLPELTDIEEKELPWTFPAGSGIHGKSFGQPLKDSIVSCIVWNKFWTDISFFPFSISKPTESLYKHWLDNERSKVDDLANDPEEKDLVVTQYADNFNEFHDTKNKAHGVVHPSGAYGMVDKDGNVFVKCTKQIKMHDENGNLEVLLDFEKGEVTLTSKGDHTETYDKDWKVVTKKNAIIEANMDVEIHAKKSCLVEAKTEATIKAMQAVIDAKVFNFKGNKSMGSVPPTGTGVFCAVPACLCTGAPHTG